ncbi:MAG TPA: hypothetical protein VFW33_17810 [Gemmataceae bacterium]|nr:hypothetical protein [Gemmataceae bacterium]
MSADVLDRLQEKKLSGLEEMLDSWDDGAVPAGGEEQAAAIADFLVDEAIGLRQRSVYHWDYNWAQALSGKLPDRGERGAELRALLERSGRVLRRYVAAARRHADLSGREVARLSQIEEQARGFPVWIEECVARWEMLDRPRKPLNRERIAKAQAAYARGEGEPVSDVVARLEQGGSLVKE